MADKQMWTKQLESLQVTTESGATLTSGDGSPILSGGAREAFVSDVADQALKVMADEVSRSFRGVEDGPLAVGQLPRLSDETKEALDNLRPQLESFADGIVDLRYRGPSDAAREASADLKELTTWYNVGSKVGDAAGMASELSPEITAGETVTERAVASMQLQAMLKNSGFTESTDVTGLSGADRNLVASFEAAAKSATQGLDAAAERIETFSKAVEEYSVRPADTVKMLEALAEKEQGNPAYASDLRNLASMASAKMPGKELEAAASEAMKKHLFPDVAQQGQETLRALSGDTMREVTAQISDRSNAVFERWDRFVTENGQRDTNNELFPLLLRVQEATLAMQQQDLKGSLGKEANAPGMNQLVKNAAEFGITPKLLKSAEGELQAFELKTGGNPADVTPASALAALVGREQQLNANPDAAQAFDKDMANPYRVLQAERSNEPSQSQLGRSPASTKEALREAPATQERSAAFVREMSR